MISATSSSPKTATFVPLISFETPETASLVISMKSLNSCIVIVEEFEINGEKSSQNDQWFANGSYLFCVFTFIHDVFKYLEEKLKLLYKYVVEHFVFQCSNINDWRIKHPKTTNMNDNLRRCLSECQKSSHPNKMIGDLFALGLKTRLARFMNSSSSLSRLSIVKPKAHFAITSMVKLLKILNGQGTKR